MLDDHTVSFRLAEPNAAFLEYMTMAILPQHLLEGEDMQESAFFRAPVGTGPYKLESWDAGQSIVLVRNEDYFLGEPNIERVIFKIVPDDNAQAMQLESGEIDLALLDPKNAQNFAGKDGYTCYDMTTAASSSTSTTPTGQKTATSSPPSATPSTVRPSSTRCCSGRAWRRTARSSATSTTTRP